MSVSFFSVNKQYHLKVTFGGSYSYCRQFRHPDILSLSPPSPDCRKFHPIVQQISFVSKTICLSIGYLLSDSETLVLQKCRIFIYVMEPTKRKRVLLTVAHKFQIMSRIEVALNFNSKLGGSKEFQASSGWLEKFKNRHGIRQLSILEEKLSSDTEAGNSFIAELQDLIVKRKLTTDQIYTCNETGLYLRALPTKTLAAEIEVVAPGRKKMKDRVTILGCANASVSHPVKLTLVGKSKKSRCFKNINKTALPVHYMQQESAG
ncbi:Jerky -like [Araneus ventricosus]|uniref:Jerky-like n=1 Tax=Araneus ventricosus TaxID=182803 RepID=A0A4Y2FIM5_ARAVE|nr:Jerky -like [Araneus ventricosus]